jgi:hypothetical protein
MTLICAAGVVARALSPSRCGGGTTAGNLRSDVLDWYSCGLALHWQQYLTVRRYHFDSEHTVAASQYLGSPGSPSTATSAAAAQAQKSCNFVGTGNSLLIDKVI